jgi:hypothetical protein
MPYSKGCTKNARNRNVALFIREGKHAAQAAAMAFSIQRRNCSCRRAVGPRGGKTISCRPRRRR